MPKDKKTKEFNIEVDGKWYSEHEYYQYFSAKEILEREACEEATPEYNTDDELERLQQKSWWDKL